MKNRFFALFSSLMIAISSFSGVAVSAETVSAGTFTNVYTPDYAYVDIDGFTKVLDGADLTDGQFSFTLYDEDENVVATAVNDADGNITFENIEFTVVGDYTWTVVETGEVDPDEDVVIECDDMVAEVYISVTYNSETEALEAAVTYQDDTEFNNTVIFPDPIYVSVTATKTLVDESNTGRGISEGEFNFQITDESGEVVSTGTNDTDGLVTFDTIEFDEAGEYTYTVTEIAGENSHIEYSTDSISFTVVVTKTDNVLYASIRSVSTLADSDSVEYTG